MLAHAPGDSLAHRLDPRTKLAFQAAFALAAFAHSTPRGLAALTPLAGGVLLAADTSPGVVYREYRALLPFLLFGPTVAALTWGPPWVAPGQALRPALASYRVALLLAVSAAYVRTTPVRESRAAIQWLVPGRPGAFLGAGVSFVLRLLPVLQADLRSVRQAIDARLGTERSLVERVRLVGETGLRRAFRRADVLALALRARCFSWNPTLPPLSFGRPDALGLASAAALVGVALL